MKALIVANPRAGRGHRAKSYRKTWHTASALLEQFYDQIDYRQTSIDVGAYELASFAASQGYQCVVAAGGDGTVHEVLNGLMDYRKTEGTECPVLGILPLGTGNDFFWSIVDHHLDTSPTVGRWIDIAQVIYDAHSCYFGLAIGSGFIGWANRHRAEITRYVRGRIAYTLAAATSFATYSIKSNLAVSVDYNCRFSGNASMVMISNGASVGGRSFQITPDSRVDDGVLEICVIAETSRMNLARIILKARSGKHVHLPEVYSFSGTHFAISLSEPLPLHIDGEVPSKLPHGASSIQVDILPSALRVWPLPVYA